MLKIKDDVNLKELEKFGFTHWSTVWKEDKEMKDESEWWYDLKFTNINKEVQVLLLRIDDNTRSIVKETRLNVLYDLIQANIVERVDDK